MVPLAVPDCPIFVDQMTDVTPTLSLAIPANEIVADEVEIVVAPGDEIVNVGGVASVPDPPPLEGTAVLVIVTTRDTLFDPIVAATVIVLTPIASVMFEIVHAAAVPAALPDTATDEDAVDHSTDIAPDPPEAVPDKLTVAALVVAAVALTVSINGGAVGDVGAGVGAGVPAPA